MKHYYLPKEGNFYKVNFHCHTTVSDGKHTPAEIKEIYRSMGYDAVCYTDHEVLVGHENLCDEHFIALHGYEVCVKQNLEAHTGDFQPVYHFNLIAKKQSMRKMPRFFLANPSMPGHSAEWLKKLGVYDEDDVIETTKYDVDWINDYLAAVEKAGYLISYNHPEWSLQTAEDVIPLEHVHGFELLNGDCLDFFGNSIICYEQLLRAGKAPFAIAGDDNHSLRSCGRAFTMIKADTLTYDALIDGYEHGACYVSEGPQFLELYREGEEIVVQTNKATRVVLRGEYRYHKMVTLPDAEKHEARFSYLPRRFGKYFRVELADDEGKKAFSQAYFI